MRFVKMHGIGNDYVYVDAVTRPEIEQRDLPALARRISDRHTGVGSDGVILLCRPSSVGRASGPPSGAHIRMRMFNADGSESEMCGNGIRCVAKFAHDRLGITAKPMRIETGRGVLSIDYTTEAGKLTKATVDMGEPILEPEKIPVDLARVRERGPHRFALPEQDALQWTFVSMGNPHATTWDLPVRHGDTEQLEKFRQIGPAVERHAAFPRRTNVHFAQALSRREANMITWERGSGFTQACGTGACAVLIAGVLTGRLDRRALLHLPGGDLEIFWDEKTNHVFKTGPATDVFEGEWPD